MVENEITFSVELYKLPKFEVKIESPTFVSEDMEGITVNVKAK